MKDRLEPKGIEVAYCPTEEMLADFFTKALQGSLFIKFKKVVMGEEHVNTLKKPSLAPVKERVENRDEVVNNEDLVPGANGQTDHDKGWTEVKRSYARVSKRGTRAPNRGAQKDAVKFRGLSQGKSEQAHSNE